MTTREKALQIKKEFGGMKDEFIASYREFLFALIRYTGPDADVSKFNKLHGRLTALDGIRKAAEAMNIIEIYMITDESDTRAQEYIDAFDKLLAEARKWRSSK